VVTITVAYNLWAPSSGDHLFTCGAIYLPPHYGYVWPDTIEIKRSVCYA